MISCVSGSRVSVLPREDAVLHVEGGVDVLPCGARARLDEALLEVVREEGVEDRVHGGVGVGEAGGEEVDGDDDGGLADVGGCADEGHLGYPVGEPAEDIDGDDGEDQLRYLSVRASLLFALVFWTHCFEFADDEAVEDEDEEEGDGEAEDEAVDGEEALATGGLVLGCPYDVAG